MTIKELKVIISNLPEETIVLVEENNVSDVGIVNVLFRSDGRTQVVFTALE